MLQIDYYKKDAQTGELKGILRIDGRKLFFQFNNSGHAQQMMAKMQEKGAIIVPGKNWIKVDMFGSNEEIKLGNKQFNMNEITADELEKLLGDFYIENYTKVGFKCTVKKIKG